MISSVEEKKEFLSNMFHDDNDGIRYYEDAILRQFNFFIGFYSKGELYKNLPAVVEENPDFNIDKDIYKPTTQVSVIENIPFSFKHEDMGSSLEQIIQGIFDNYFYDDEIFAESTIEKLVQPSNHTTWSGKTIMLHKYNMKIKGKALQRAFYLNSVASNHSWNIKLLGVKYPNLMLYEESFANLLNNFNPINNTSSRDSFSVGLDKETDSEGYHTLNIQINFKVVQESGYSINKILSHTSGRLLLNLIKLGIAINVISDNLIPVYEDMKVFNEKQELTKNKVKEFGEKQIELLVKQRITPTENINHITGNQYATSNGIEKVFLPFKDNYELPKNLILTIYRHASLAWVPALPGKFDKFSSESNFVEIGEFFYQNARETSSNRHSDVHIVRSIESDELEMIHEGHLLLDPLEEVSLNNLYTVNLTSKELNQMIYDNLHLFDDETKEAVENSMKIEQEFPRYFTKVNEKTIIKGDFMVISDTPLLDSSSLTTIKFHQIIDGNLNSILLKEFGGVKHVTRKIVATRESEREILETFTQEDNMPYQASTNKELANWYIQAGDNAVHYFSDNPEMAELLEQGIAELEESYNTVDYLNNLIPSDVGVLNAPRIIRIGNYFLLHENGEIKHYILANKGIRSVHSFVKRLSEVENLDSAIKYKKNEELFVSLISIDSGQVDYKFVRDFTILGG